jgi:hypothetical protein
MPRYEIKYDAKKIPPMTMFDWIKSSVNVRPYLHNVSDGVIGVETENSTFISEIERITQDYFQK